MTYYNSADTCDKIKENGKRCGSPLNRKGLKERNNVHRIWTGRWICYKCWYDDYKLRLGDNILDSYNEKEDRYKSNRIIDGKVRWIIVDETGKIINKNPIEHELKGLYEEKYDKRDKSKPFISIYNLGRCPRPLGRG